MVQPPGYAWYDAVYRCFCRQFEGCEEKAALPGSMQRKLPASDAVFGYPEGKKRWRLCGSRLPEGTADSGYDGGVGFSVQRLP